MFTVQELKQLDAFLEHARSEEGDNTELNALRDKIKKQLTYVDWQGHVYVDLPQPDRLTDSDDSEWTNVYDATSVPDAVAWLNKYVGGCDEFGNINLLTLGNPEDAEEDAADEAAAEEEMADGV